jgi:hypothetical protein
MNAAALETLQVNVPCILKSHPRDAQSMALGTFQEIAGLAFGFAIGPVSTNVFFRPFCRSLCADPGRGIK